MNPGGNDHAALARTTRHEVQGAGRDPVWPQVLWLTLQTGAIATAGIRWSAGWPANGTAVAWLGTVQLVASIGLFPILVPHLTALVTTLALALPMTALAGVIDTGGGLRTAPVGSYLYVCLWVTALWAVQRCCQDPGNRFLLATFGTTLTLGAPALAYLGAEFGTGSGVMGRLSPIYPLWFKNSSHSLPPFWFLPPALILAACGARSVFLTKKSG